MRRYLLALFVAGLPASVHSQGATFAGRIMRDTSGKPVAEAEVELPMLGRSTRTDVLGRFQFARVAAGRYAVVVRAIGFEPLIDSVDLQSGVRIDADIVLTPLPVRLETQHATAPAAAGARSPMLEAMDQRRKAHLGGYFVTDSALRANDEQKLTYFLATIPGIRQILSIGGVEVYVASARQQGEGRGGPKFPGGTCYITVFVDGLRYFVGPSGPTNPPPDFHAMWAGEYSGIEFYPGGSSVPAQYNATGTDCGTLLLWTRR
jgi:hypothetical protein